MFKRAMVFILACVFLSGCSQGSSNRYSSTCPFCDSHIEYDIEPEDVAEWLDKQGDYLVFYDYENYVEYVISNLRDILYDNDLLPGYMDEFLANNPDWVEDILNDRAAEYLEENGWTVIPPGGKK